MPNQPAVGSASAAAGGPAGLSPPTSTLCVALRRAFVSRTICMSTSAYPRVAGTGAVTIMQGHMLAPRWKRMVLVPTFYVFQGDLGPVRPPTLPAATKWIHTEPFRPALIGKEGPEEIVYPEECKDAMPECKGWADAGEAPCTGTFSLLLGVA